ncbi:MAG: methionine biosynthesis protein MetW [Pelagibacteraceae bacterium]|nr:methionine biosynthesis protein MetW [Pelagibacteraceae bacterium]|tara:strand:- start:1798 stop:2391 length:594 start_codon:yes stop_codon:yes gene_type:complete
MRNDYKIIFDLIPSNSKVLDIGCSSGELLSLLNQKENIQTQGVEINQEKVVKCLENGLDVVQGDINQILEDFPHNQFDYCLLTKTIQTVNQPDKLLQLLKKVGKNIIISFDNSNYYKRVIEFAFKGSFDKLLQKSNKEQWFNSPNIHPCSIKDFTILAKQLGFNIIESFDVKNNRRFKFPKTPSNIFCKEVLFSLNT